MNFIGKFTVENPSLCDDLISESNNNPEWISRRVPGSLSTGVINPEHKRSTDVAFFKKDHDHPLIKKYLEHVQIACHQYVEEFPKAGNDHPWGLVEPFNLQKYLPGEAFFGWHTERNGSSSSMSRHLVFMTYLNTVSEGGETEFYHQKIKVKPERGLSLIWPADWTHYHRGLPSHTQEKYIITGWLSYIS